MYTNTHVYIHIDMYIIYPCIIYIYICMWVMTMVADGCILGFEPPSLTMYRIWGPHNYGEIYQSINWNLSPKYMRIMCSYM